MTRQPRDDRRATSHDEWNIWQGLNERRRRTDQGIADQIAGYFDGRQIDPASFSMRAAAGYEGKAPVPETRTGRRPDSSLR